MRRSNFDLWRETNAVQLAFNLTGDCNLSCNYCAVRPGETNSHNNFNPEDIQEIYEEVRQFHEKSFLEVLCLAKGEPLLNWPAIEAIEKIRQHDKKVTCFIPTNGTIEAEKIFYLAEHG